jgi:hypothetical protein
VADLQVQREICCVIMVQLHAKGIERLEKYAGMAIRELVEEEMQFVGLSPTTRLIFTRTSFNLVNIRKENRNPMELLLGTYFNDHHQIFDVINRIAR